MQSIPSSKQNANIDCTKTPFTLNVIKELFKPLFLGRPFGGLCICMCEMNCCYDFICACVGTAGSFAEAIIWSYQEVENWITEALFRWNC